MNKVVIDKETYIEVTYFDKDYCKVRVKYQKDRTTKAYLEIKLSCDNIDKLVSELTSARAKIYGEKL